VAAKTPAFGPIILVIQTVAWSDLKSTKSPNQNPSPSLHGELQGIAVAV
jgi:hypothetical protein